MNIEIMQLKTKLAESKNKAKELDVKISRLFYEMKASINPYYEDISEIESDKILQIAQELSSTVNELKVIKEKIHKLERDLG